MNKAFLVSLAALLAAAPFAYAHDPSRPLATPDGTPKFYCEDLREWLVHDYGPVANGIFNFLPTDGNVEDCDVSGSDAFLSLAPCPFGWDQAEVIPGILYVCYHLATADYDGHREFAQGGAVLLACDLWCGSSGAGGGSSWCYAEPAHHSSTITVIDALLGAGATFRVGVDDVDAAAQAAGLPGDPCGDFQIDQIQTCVGSCTAAFGPGLDGAYYVSPIGTIGHVTTA